MGSNDNDNERQPVPKTESGPIYMGDDPDPDDRKRKTKNINSTRHEDDAKAKSTKSPKRGKKNTKKKGTKDLNNSPKRVAASLNRQASEGDSKPSVQAEHDDKESIARSPLPPPKRQSSVGLIQQKESQVRKGGIVDKKTRQQRTRQEGKPNHRDGRRRQRREEEKKSQAPSDSSSDDDGDDKPGAVHMTGLTKQTETSTAQEQQQEEEASDDGDGLDNTPTPDNDNLVINVPLAAEISPDILAENEQLRQQLEEQRQREFERDQNSEQQQRLPILVGAVAIQDAESNEGEAQDKSSDHRPRSLCLIFGIFAVIAVVGSIVGIVIAVKDKETEIPTMEPTSQPSVRLRITPMPATPAPTPTIEISKQNCPCYADGESLEFVLAVDEAVNLPNDDVSCFQRVNSDEYLTALNTCLQGLTAYMSYDYRDGGEARYCGDSINSYFVDTLGGLACEKLLLEQSEEAGVECNDQWC